MPGHLYFIDALLDAYPDARLIWTHRDPVKVMASFLDLVGFAHGLSMGEADADWIRAIYPPRLAEYLRRAEAAFEDLDVAVHHVQFADLVGDPIGEVGRLYTWAGATLTAATEQAMREWVAADPIRRPRKRPYSLADWGLSPDDLDPAFTNYASRYEVQSET